MKVSTEGRVRAGLLVRRGSHSSSGTLGSFSLPRSLGKSRFAVNLAEILSSVP